MALTKDKKKQIIEKLEKSISGQKIMLFVGIAKLKTKDLFDLKKNLKVNGNILTVVKKTLFQIAAKNNGIEINTKKLDGEVAIIFGSEDEVSAANIINKFSKKNENLKILGGFFEKEVIASDKVVVLASIPPRQELLAKLVGSINAPVSGFVTVLNGNIRGLVLALNAIANNKK
jgi:large subunit ribosomal protein L10